MTSLTMSYSMTCACAQIYWLSVTAVLQNITSLWWLLYTPSSCRRHQRSMSNMNKDVRCRTFTSCAMAHYFMCYTFSLVGADAQGSLCIGWAWGPMRKHAYSKQIASILYKIRGSYSMLVRSSCMRCSSEAGIMLRGRHCRPRAIFPNALTRGIVTRVFTAHKRNNRWIHSTYILQGWCMCFFNTLGQQQRFVTADQCCRLTIQIWIFW